MHRTLPDPSPRATGRATPMLLLLGVVAIAIGCTGKSAAVASVPASARAAVPTPDRGSPTMSSEHSPATASSPTSSSERTRTEAAATTTTTTTATSTPTAPAAPTAARLDAKPADEELRGRLTPLQYRVTQQDGTEPPFHNEYWNNHADGIYVDVVTGEPLFSSRDKFESGTGWPSFTRPLSEDAVSTKTDRHLFMQRTEVRSAKGDSHLGHVFDDGPAPTGLRYCMNSASLRFVPASRLAAEGYGEYAKLFATRSE